MCLLSLIHFTNMQTSKLNFLFLAICIFNIYMCVCHLLLSNYCSYARLSVEGYDPSLSKNDIERALIELFSSYGEITVVIIFEWFAASSSQFLLTAIFLNFSSY